MNWSIAVLVRLALSVVFLVSAAASSPPRPRGDVPSRIMKILLSILAGAFRELIG
jgi:hypothetical protein